MATVGFLTFTDFLEEIKNSSFWAQPVRVQQYHKSTNDERMPSVKYFTFIVEAAVQVIDEVLVCRFITGRTNAIPGSDEGRLKKLDERNRRAAAILVHRLKEEGFLVSRGLIAAAAGSQTEADPDGLWTIENLIAGEMSGESTDEP